MSWLTTVTRLQNAGYTSVAVSVVKVEGSSPRAVGTRMIVCSDTEYGTIGGGNLEYQALKTAREILRHSIDHPQSQRPAIQQIAYTLGEDLVQCCGGRVTLMYEVFLPAPASIVVFGAGHVGTELMRILARLPLRITWYDERPDYVSRAKKTLDGPVADITVAELVQPIVTVEQCAAQTLFVVLTHSHALDFELVEAIVSRDDTAFCGLIASKSKAAAFRARLKRKGFSDEETERLTAPVGVASKGLIQRGDTVLPEPLFAGLEKEPMVIAVAIAQQLLGLPVMRSARPQVSAGAPAVTG